jgi:hypothetical protein
MLAGVKEEIAGVLMGPGAGRKRSPSALSEAGRNWHPHPPRMTPCDLPYSIENKRVIQTQVKNKAKIRRMLLLRNGLTSFWATRIALKEKELQFIRFLSRRNRNSHA